MNSFVPRLPWAFLAILCWLVMGPPRPVAADPQDTEVHKPTSDKAARDAPADMEDFALGFRLGLSDHRNEEYFRKYEAFLNWYLPWAWRSASGWIVAPRIDFTGAALKGGGTTGFLGSIGPSLAVRKVGWILAIDFGISPAYLSEDRYGKEDMSGHIQFLSHGGVSLLPFRNLGVGYRFQHVSNADIQQPNPGINMHSLELNYRF